MKLFLLLVLSNVVLMQTSATAAEPEEVQPYLEKFKAKHSIKPPVKQLPAESARTAAPQKPESYSTIERSEGETQPYLDQMLEKQGVRADKPYAGEVQPYLESVKRGKDLKAKMKGTVSSAAGLVIVAQNSFHVSSTKIQSNNFNSVYSTTEKYNPSVDLFYEKQLYRSRYFGAIGPVFHVNFITTKGKGVFIRSGAQSTDTEFRFFAVPVSAGVSYRFVQPRFVVPFAQAALVAIPMLETRNDDKAARRAISRGFSLTGGVSLNLDWIGRSNAWNLYDSSGVLHTYLTVQVQKYVTTVGTVQFDYSGTYAGLTFEF